LITSSFVYVSQNKLVTDLFKSVRAMEIRDNMGEVR